MGNSRAIAEGEAGEGGDPETGFLNELASLSMDYRQKPGFSGDRHGRAED
ncbi:MAG: hypothetical protein HC866_09840 [Leptolyngbyaceae cyanobacterium RU_5_1]|nr:hypothetical protein [Leptolyngbyaceae cyanobacterium RU_5_1]